MSVDFSFSFNRDTLTGDPINITNFVLMVGNTEVRFTKNDGIFKPIDDLKGILGNLLYPKGDLPGVPIEDENLKTRIAIFYDFMKELGLPLSPYFDLDSVDSLDVDSLEDSDQLVKLIMKQSNKEVIIDNAEDKLITAYKQAKKDLYKNYQAYISNMDKGNYKDEEYKATSVHIREDLESKGKEIKIDEVSNLLNNLLANADDVGRAVTLLIMRTKNILNVAITFDNLSQSILDVLTSDDQNLITKLLDSISGFGEAYEKWKEYLSSKKIFEGGSIPIISKHKKRSSKSSYFTNITKRHRSHKKGLNHKTVSKR